MKTFRSISVVTIAVLATTHIPSYLIAQAPKRMEACDQSWIEKGVSATDISSSVQQGRAMATQIGRSSQGGADPVMDWLDVMDDASGDLLRVSTSANQPTVNLSPTTLGFRCGDNRRCFGCYPANLQRTVTLTNLGPGVLDITGIT